MLVSTVVGEILNVTLSFVSGEQSGLNYKYFVQSGFALFLKNLAAVLTWLFFFNIFYVSN